MIDEKINEMILISSHLVDKYITLRTDVTKLIEYVKFLSERTNIDYVNSGNNLLMVWIVDKNDWFNFKFDKPNYITNIRNFTIDIGVKSNLELRVRQIFDISSLNNKKEILSHCQMGLEVAWGGIIKDYYREQKQKKLISQMYSDDWRYNPYNSSR